MSRKKILQQILNTALKKRITEIFGKNSYIEIRNINYVRSKNCHSINAVLYMDDVENSISFFPDISDDIIRQAWSIVGDKKPIIINFSLDVP